MKKVKNLWRHNSNAGSGFGWRSSDKWDGTKGWCWGEEKGCWLLLNLQELGSEEQKEMTEATLNNVEKQENPS